MIRKGLAGGSFQPLTPESISRVHEAVLHIIEEVGFEVNSKIALEYFKGAGAWVDEEQQRVRLPQPKVLELIGLAPSEVRLWGRRKSMTSSWGVTGYTRGRGEPHSIYMSRIPDRSAWPP